MKDPHPVELERPQLIPDGFSATPEVTILLPALNEALTIVECVEWCREGFRLAGVEGELLIIDSSTDDTADLALAGGARVVKTPKRGLGRAYIDALPFIRGKFVLMGDCDCTYDFRRVGPFVEKFRQGCEFIMGSRYRGSIEPGAMPKLHQYFGTPFTTWILNRIFSSHFSDIHCGMRGITLAALRKMCIVSTSWEYASEMVIKSVLMGLRKDEVPVAFYKDRNGRVSLHRRLGWWSPWQAGWINLKAMFIFGTDFFLTRPGWVLLSLGAMLQAVLVFGPVTLGPVTLSVFWMLFGLLLSVLGLQCVFMGILSQLYFDYEGEKIRRFMSRFRYTRTTLVSATAFAMGLLIEILFLRNYIRQGFLLFASEGADMHRAVFGLFLIIFAFMTFTFGLILNAYQQSNRSRVHLKQEEA